MKKQDINKKEEIKESIKPVEGTEQKNETQELIELIKQQASDIKMLTAIADKKALAQYYQRNVGKIPLHVKLRVLDGKVIVGWRTLVDISEFDIVLRRFKEVQTLEVIFEDGTKKEMSLVDFNRHYTYVECEQIGTIQEDDSLIIKLKRLDTGQEYHVNVQYVN